MTTHTLRFLLSRALGNPCSSPLWTDFTHVVFSVWQKQWFYDTRVAGTAGSVVAGGGCVVEWQL